MLILISGGVLDSAPRTLNLSFLHGRHKLQIPRGLEYICILKYLIQAGTSFSVN